MALPGLVTIRDVEVIAQNLARQVDGRNTQLSPENLSPHIEPVALIGLGLGSIADRSLIDVLTPRRGRSLVDVEFGSGASEVKGQGKLDFVPRADVRGEEGGDQDGTPVLKPAGGLVALRLGLRNHTVTDGFGGYRHGLNGSFHNWVQHSQLGQSRQMTKPSR